jgi:phospholipase/carboxylesterase
MSGLVSDQRAAAVTRPAGLLIVHHGRGSDEHDLIGIADILDPARQLQVVAPRAPLRLPGSPGFHWYVVPRVGYPDPATFDAAYRALAAFHDEVWERTGIPPERTILGGFSMGAVMSYALGLAAERPPPAGILAFSGFIPTVVGWQPSLADRTGLRVFITHGLHDTVMEIGFARRARDLLTAGGLDVEYHEHGGGHEIDPSHLGAAAGWLRRTLGLGDEATSGDIPDHETRRK